MVEHMAKTSWVEICVSDFERSIAWFESVLGFRVAAREANDYAELSHGETSIQLATDHAAYWEPELPHLLAPGQRGSGVEIALLVDNVDAVYRQAQQAGADIVRPLADYPWHMRQFWVRHPDGYLIRPAQRILSVNPDIYRHQVDEAFRSDKPHITHELLAVKQTADRLAQQGDALGAATIYETLITEILERSHLYHDEDEDSEYDNYDEEEGYYPEEEGLEELVEECIAALGGCLADERTDRVAREKSIEALFDIYERDLHSLEDYGFFSTAAEQLVQYATLLERQTIAEWINALLNDEKEKVISSRRHAYGKFLLDLQQDTLDDEAYLRICRETGRTSDLIDRLLTLGRVEEAEKETQGIADTAFLRLVDLFIQHGQDAVAERLVRARNQEKPELHFLEWLQRYYGSKDNVAAEFAVTETMFRMRPSLRLYQQLRNLAARLARWETLRPELLAFLEQAKNTTILIQIALDEGDIDRALQLLKGMGKQDSHSYTYTTNLYGFGDIALQVARAAEESRPHEAIELYRQRAESLIAQRSRQNYQQACTFLAIMRTLYEKLSEHEAWMRYVTALREQHRNLPALKDELKKAGL